MDKPSTYQSRLIIGIFAVFCIGYGLYIHYDRENALRVSEKVTATVTGKFDTRQGVFIYVSYRYLAKDLQSYFSSGEDTLDVGDKVIIEVSKSKPNTYVKLIGRKK